MTIEDAKYEFFEKLYESSSTIIYRGENRVNDLPVVIKLIKEQDSSQELISKLSHEFEIGNKLSSIKGIIRYYNFGKIHNNYGIVMEDIGAISLSNILKTEAIDISPFHASAVKNSRIINKNLNE